MASQVSSMAIAVMLLFLFMTSDFSVADELADVRQSSASTMLLIEDEAVIAENVYAIVQRTAVLSADERFERLALWVLPTPDRPEFRMNSLFLQTDPMPGSTNKLQEGTCEGILSPCFALIRAAEQSGRLEELRQRIEAIPDSAKPHALRAKLAMLLMVQCALQNTDASSALCGTLSQQVRVRTDNLNGRWWPETLALAWGMQRMQNRVELMELATAIYEKQVVPSQSSGQIAWDIFVGGCYGHLRLETDGLAKAENDQGNLFKRWKPASVVTAETRGLGHPQEVWRIQGNTVHKVVGHNNDYLYFPAPLVGNFEIDCDISGFNFRETQLAFAGLFASHNWRLSEAEIGGIRNQSFVPLDPPMTNPDDWLTCRITVHNGICKHFINGRLIIERTLQEGDFPWLAFRAYWLSRGSIRNLVIKGEPKIPNSVAMLNNPGLTGWFSCFDEPIGDDESHPNARVATAAAEGKSWRRETSADGAAELIHPASPELAGTNAESLVLYHRPMMEDGVIEYEFFYEPEKSTVHPTLDRLSFLIEPDGVKTHWVTDGIFQRDELTPDNTFESNELAGRFPLPLKSSAWNQMQLSLKGDRVHLVLNGEMILSTTLAAGNRRQFGLFHFADQSSVRVRNMNWTGEWPKSVDPAVFPPSIRPDVATIEEAIGKLPESFHHDFRNANLPRNAFLKKHAGIQATDDGVITQCQSLDGWRQTDVAVSLDIGGDFDLQASFRDLQWAGNGNLGVQLMATLAGSGQEIRIARNRWDKGDDMMKCQIGIARVQGQWQYTDTWSKLSSNEGIFRLARLSDTLYYMFAESEASAFRILHTEKIGTENLRVGDTSLSVFSDIVGTVRCVWTGLHIRAERLSGTALINTDEVLKTLNEQREKLPVHHLIDFERSAPDPREFFRSDDEPEWNAADQGLVLESIGQDGWVASMLSSRRAIDGDFDVTLNLGQTELARPAEGRDSGLFWQVQQQGNDQTRFTSIFLRTLTDYKVTAQQHRFLPDGSQDYTRSGDQEVKNVSSLRIARRGKTYTMLARQKDAEHDDVIHQAEHFDGPVILQCLLHTGNTGKKSRAVLKSIEVHAEVYNRPPVLRFR
jgi:hypothetical protein